MLNDVAYHTDYTALSKTMLAKFAADSFTFHETYVRTPPTMFPDEPDEKMNFGSAAHEILLHARPFDDVVIRYPDYCLNKKDGLIGDKALIFRAENADKLCFKPADAARLMDVLDAVHCSPIGDLIESAVEREEKFYWVERDVEVRCRCKPDFWCDLDDVTAVYDLKFSEDISDMGFRRSMESQQWYLQDSHYSAGMIHRFKKPCKFRFWSIETVYPYRVFPRSLDLRSRELSMGRRRELLVDLKDRHTSGDWTAKWSTSYALWPKWQD